MLILAPQALVLPDGPGLQFPALFCAAPQILTNLPTSHSLEVHPMAPNRQFLTEPHCVVCLLAFLPVVWPKLPIYPAQCHHNSSCIP